MEKAAGNPAAFFEENTNSEVKRSTHRSGKGKVKTVFGALLDQII